MKHAMLGAALALATVAPAVAQDVKWVSLYSDRDGETFYDPASLKRTGDSVALSLRSVAKGADSWVIATVEIDCKKQTIAFLAGKEFGADGALLRSTEIDNGRIERQPLYEGEDIGATYRAACPKGAPLKVFDGPPIIVSPRTN